MVLVIGSGIESFIDKQRDKGFVTYVCTTQQHTLALSTYFGDYLIHIHQAKVNNMSYSEQYEIKSLHKVCI